MGTLMSHVEYLAETIGPRPATSDAESRAAGYIRDACESRGLETEVQSFDSPRTYAWAYVIFHLLTIAAAVASRWFPWPAAVLGIAVAVGMWLDLDTRVSLSSIMPRHPSQNVIARHCPKAGRGERIQKVVIVAHYDSARSSLAFSPGMVKNFATTFGLMKGCTIAVPVLVFAGMIPFVNGFPQYTWYVTLVPAAYLLVPLLINVHRELFMKFTPGANDNASGVAAMLGVLERLVPEPDAAALISRETAKMRTEEDAWAAGVVPDGAVLSYAPVAAPAPRADSWSDDEDISWDTGVISGQSAMPLERPVPAAPRVEATPPVAPTPASATRARLFGTGAIMPRPGQPTEAFAPVDPASPSPAPTSRDAAVSRAQAPDLGFDVDFDDEPTARRSASGMPLDAIDEDTFADSAPRQSGPDLFGGGSPSDGAAPMPAPRAVEEPKRRGLFGGGRKKADAERHGVRDWLGLGDDFDARKKGKDIGSWDNFVEDDDTDDTGRKGGTAAIEGLDDPDFAASVAARIRRKVTMNVDRELVEKEIWFVATGAEEIGTFGMKAFLRKFAPDLKDAVIINLDNLGAGAVSYVTREGMWKLYDSDRRLVGAAKRAVREADLPIKGREYRGLSTDATPALARGFRAMSVMAFDINGRLPNWHWRTDTADNVSEGNLETAVDFVTALIKEL
jgi:hypothetical protein